MLNYYTVFDYDNQRVGFAPSNHVDQVHYWYDVLYLASISLAVFGTISFLVSLYNERREKRLLQTAVMIPGESEMSENPSSRS